MLLVGTFASLTALGLLVHFRHPPKPPHIVPMSTAAAPREAAASSTAVAPSELPRDANLEPLPPIPTLARDAPKPSVTSSAPEPPAPTTAPLANAPSAAQPTAADVRQALRSVKVVMFSTSWCSVCARARSFLQANGIAFEERDIDRDEAARLELQRRTGRSAIPTLVIEGQQLDAALLGRAAAAVKAWRQ